VKKQFLYTQQWPERKIDVHKIDNHVTLASQLKSKTNNRSRWNKAEVYKIAGNVLRKFSVKGNYIGLSDTYISEIISTLSPQIEGQVVNCEWNKSRAEMTKKHTELVNQLDSNSHSFFAGDIFKKIEESENTYSIIDLDLMWCLNEEKLNKIVKGVEKAATNKCCLLLWTCYGHAITQDKYNNEMRPQLIKSLRNDFKILDHKSLKYRDNVIPIKVEILILSRRNRKQTTKEKRR